MELSPAWLLGWRCLYALAFALVPSVFAPDAATADDVNAVMLRALVGFAGASALAFVLLRRVRGAPRAWPSWTAVAVFALALTAGATLPTATVPLGASAWVLAPLSWATLAGAAARAGWRESRRIGVAVSLLGAVSLALAAPRLRSRDALWEAVTRTAPAHASAWRARVALALERGDDAGARRLLARCITASPTAWPCALDLSERHLRAHDLPLARSMAERVLAQRPGHPRATTLRALSLALQVPVASEALDAARQAVERDARSADAHYALALALDAAGRYDEARTHARSARTLGGGGEVMVLQSLLALRGGDTAEARRSVEQALRGGVDAARGYYQLGLVEQRAGRYNQAREAYLRALSIDRDAYAARYNLAVLAHGVGADEEARHHADVLLRKHPDDAAALALLREIASATPSPAATLRPATR